MQQDFFLVLFFGWAWKQRGMKEVLFLDESLIQKLLGLCLWCCILKFVIKLKLSCCDMSNSMHLTEKLYQPMIVASKKMKLEFLLMDFKLLFIGNLPWMDSQWIWFTSLAQRTVFKTEFWCLLRQRIDHLDSWVSNYWKVAENLIIFDIPLTLLEICQSGKDSLQSMLWERDQRCAAPMQASDSLQVSLLSCLLMTWVCRATKSASAASLLISSSMCLYSLYLINWLLPAKIPPALKHKKEQKFCRGEVAYVFIYSQTPLRRDRHWLMLLLYLT